MGPGATAALSSLAALCALLYLRVQAAGLGGPVRLVKLGPALLLAATLPDRPLLAVGFVFYAGGDLALLEKGRWFLVGLGSFLIGHLCVIAGLLAGAPPDPVGLGAGLILAGVMTTLLWPGLRGPLRAAVPVYAAALAGLLAAAVARSPLCGLGAGIFLLSDALLAWNRFRTPFRGAETAVLVTYYTAIGLIAAG